MAQEEVFADSPPDAQLLLGTCPDTPADASQYSPGSSPEESPDAPPAKRGRINECAARKYFEKQATGSGAAQWVCTLCRDQKRPKSVFKSCDASTSFMWKHLRALHRTEHDVLKGDTAPKTPTTMERYASGVGMAFDPDRFRKAVTAWIILEDQPFAQVSSPYLFNMLQFANPRTALVSRSQVPRDILSLYKEIKPKICAKLKANGSKISFTTDEWTSPNHMAFKAITAHWVSDDFELQHCVLGFERIKGMHTGGKLYEAFVSVMTDIDLPLDRVWGLTLDNAATNTAFVNILGRRQSFPGEQHFRCFAHVVNLICNTIMTDYGTSRIAQKLRCIARYVNAGGSAQRADAWRSYCPRMLQADVRTRWSSTMNMLSKGLSMRECIKRWLSTISVEDRQGMEITEVEWDEIQLLLDLLKPFADATNHVTTLNSSVTLSFVVPWYDKLYYGLLEQLENPGLALYHVPIQNAAAKLDSYYQECSQCYTTATFLDPSMKMAYFDRYSKLPGHDSVQQVEQQIRCQLSPYLAKNHATIGPSEAASQASSKAQSTLEALLGELGPSVDELDEIDHYMRDPRIAMHEDPLLYWKVNAQRFPGLAMAARDFLAAPGTSAPSERAFSHGRQLMIEYRHNLGDEMIKACQLLKSWLPLVPV